jgi:hypothetical protein
MTGHTPFHHEESDAARHRRDGNPLNFREKALALRGRSL